MPYPVATLRGVSSAPGVHCVVGSIHTRPFVYSFHSTESTGVIVTTAVVSEGHNRIRDH